MRLTTINEGENLTIKKLRPQPGKKKFMIENTGSKRGNEN